MACLTDSDHDDLSKVDVMARKNSNTTTPLYTVRRIKIGKSEQLDTLALECGSLYSETVKRFWRTVRHKGIWLREYTMMRWVNSHKLHAHTADACVQAFFASLKSWRTRRKADPLAKPPYKLKNFFQIEYKNTAIRLRDGQLICSNGKGNVPTVLDWKFDLPQTLIIHWDDKQYEAIATYKVQQQDEPRGDKVVGIDLGEVHLAVAYDGEQCTILNGRFFRSKRQYQNKLKAKLFSLIDVKKKGSRRRKRLVKSKRKQLTKLNHQIKDIQHKLTTALITTLHERGVRKLVIGDLRNVRQNNDKGKLANQKIHQMLSGKTRFMLTYKAERLGMETALQEESYTSQTCPRCGTRHKPTNREYVCKNPACGFHYHRDGVGSLNIRSKYLGLGQVVAVMAPATGIRFTPHLCVARSLLRETAGF